MLNVSVDNSCSCVLVQSIQGEPLFCSVCNAVLDSIYSNVVNTQCSLYFYFNEENPHLNSIGKSLLKTMLMLFTFIMFDGVLLPFRCATSVSVGQ